MTTDAHNLEIIGAGMNELARYESFTCTPLSGETHADLEWRSDPNDAKTALNARPVPQVGDRPFC